MNPRRPHRPSFGRGNPHKPRIASTRRLVPPASIGEWQTHEEAIHSDLLRERVIIANAREAGRMGSDAEVWEQIFSLVHSASTWLSDKQIAIWLWLVADVHFTGPQINSTLRRADAYWHYLWIDLRFPVVGLASIYRVRMADLLWTPGVFEKLADWQPPVGALTKRTDLVALGPGYHREMRHLLARHWFALSSRTRQSARAYMGPVVDVLHRDHGMDG